MKKKVFVIVIAVLCIVALFSLSACKNVQDQHWSDDLDLLKKVLDYIDAHYIGDLNVDLADVLASLAVVGGLDRFSYLTDGNTTVENNAGIGLMIQITNYREHIISLILDNSPASEVKEDGFRLMRGDYIYAVNGNRVEGLDGIAYQEFASGGAGTTLELAIKRDGVLLEKSYSYTKVEANFAQAIYVGNIGGSINEELGYIRLRSFTGSAANDFDKCMERLIEENKKGLILDLRGNSGGQSSILERVASYFVPLNELEQRTILELDYKESGTERRLLVSVKKDNYLDMPLIVLTDGSTASASEALIGAVKAFNKNNVAVIGQSTFGKGVFQNYPVELVDKQGDKTYAFFISLVTGYYYIVDDKAEGGRYCIHENPLVPDIVSKTEKISDLFLDNEIIDASIWYNSLNN